jgi:hypothetical protein
MRPLITACDRALHRRAEPRIHLEQDFARVIADARIVRYGFFRRELGLMVSEGRVTVVGQRMIETERVRESSLQTGARAGKNGSAPTAGCNGGRDLIERRG